MGEYNENFEPIELSIGTKRVTWEYIGEGLGGEYSRENPNDIPLLRFSCDQLFDTGWEGMEDASYCTYLPIDTPLQNLILALGSIMEAIQSEDYKRKLEHLSWLSPEMTSGLKVK